MKWLIPICMPIHGILMMAVLLDIRLKEVPRAKLASAFCFALIVLVSNMLAVGLISPEIYRRYYLLFVQLPSFICFIILSRFRGIKLLFVLLTAITFSSIPLNTIRLLELLTQGNIGIMFLGWLGTGLFVLFITIKFFKPNLVYMLEHGENKMFALFCLLPTVLYIYAYFKADYGFSQGINQFFINRVPVILVILSYLLLMHILKSVREKQLLEHEKKILVLRLEAFTHQIDEMKKAEQQTRLYRHDMRHHLALIHAYLAEGSIDRLQQYLRNTEKDISAITPARYSENITANLILSSFADKAKSAGIDLIVQSNLPETLHISDAELCALLSNCLENAVNATAEIHDTTNKKINCICNLLEDKLLLYVQNPHLGEVVLESGKPTTGRNGHGFGVKSIVSIVEKYNGVYSFEGKGGVFTVRLVL